MSVGASDVRFLGLDPTWLALRITSANDPEQTSDAFFRAQVPTGALSEGWLGR